MNSISDLEFLSILTNSSSKYFRLSRDEIMSVKALSWNAFRLVRRRRVMFGTRLRTATRVSVPDASSTNMHHSE